MRRAGERTYRRCAQGAHQHLICCGLVIECPAGVIAGWLAHLRATSDFVLDPVLINAPGLCGCAAAASPRRNRRAAVLQAARRLALAPPTDHDAADTTST